MKKYLKRLWEFIIDRANRLKEDEFSIKKEIKAER